MKFGHFDDDAREYVITTPRTPLPWINYLGSEAFFSLVSHTAGGYSFYKDAKLRRITRYRYNNVPADSNGRYYYIKEGSAIWNPGWQPTQTELDFHECRHGLGYSIITGKKNGLAARLELFVPVGDNCEIDRLVLTNESDAPKSFTVFSYVEFCLWNAVDDSTNFQRNFSTGEVEVEGSTIYHKTEYRERRDHYALYTVNAPVDGFDTSRDAFLGAKGSKVREAICWAALNISTTVMLAASELSFVSPMSELNSVGKATRAACGRMTRSMICPELRPIIYPASH